MHQGSKLQNGSRIQAVLDVGSSKTSCLIIELAARANPDGVFAGARVLGVGYQRSRGIKGGVVFDPVAVEQTIRAAVDKAERQAGFSLDQIAICLNAGRVRSQNYDVALDLGGVKVSQSHIEALLQKGWARIAHSTDAILHSMSLGFALDGVSGIGHPVGFSGQRLSAGFHVVSADLSHVRRLLSCVEDAYLSPVSVIIAPYASALATVRPLEVREGVAVLDLGGGTSSLAVFAQDRFVFANSLAKGGVALSAALARKFELAWSDAERLKLHIGTRVEGSIAYPKGRELIAQQYMGIFLHQKQQMLDSGFVFDAVKYVVLTGGGALYRDAPRIAAEIFGKPVRVGVPDAASGMPSQLINPAFSALWGSVVFQESGKEDLADRFAGEHVNRSRGPRGRFGNWLHRLKG